MDDEIMLNEDGEIDQLLNQLTDAIRRSEEYRRYEEAYHAICEVPDLYNRVNELRRNNYALQNGRTGVMSNEEYIGISNFSKSLREEPLVNRFLNAEVELGRLVQHISRRVFDCIDFDTDFL